MISGELLLELEGGGEAGLGTGLVAGGALALDPVTQQRVGEPLEPGAVEAVVVAEDAEAVLAAIPDVPDEGTVVEELGVLGEEVVAQPVVEVLAGRAGLGEEALEQRRRPGIPVGPGEQGAQALGGRALAADRRRHEAIGVSELVERIGLLVGPAVAEQTGDRDLERRLRPGDGALEQPLGRVVGVGLGQAVGVLLGRHLRQCSRSKGTSSSSGARRPDFWWSRRTTAPARR